jgi:hypothetical protein
MTKARRSRKVDNRPTQKSLVRLAVVLVVLAALVGGAALLFTPEQTPFVPEVIGAPRVAVAQEVVDFGDVPVNKPVQAVFKVRNIGDQTLHVLDKEPLLTVVEGCCPPRTVLSSTVIQPGGEATLSVQFTMHPGMDGPHDFRVYLRTNDPLEPEKELQILSNWVSQGA